MMNDTKQKILKKSLKLFNDHGVSNVSLRTIADELAISVGNLQYHFKKREDIIEGLYFQLVEKIDKLAFEEAGGLLQGLLKFSTEMFTILYDYHFFLLDFVTISRGNKKIKNHYSKLSKRRQEESLVVVALLIQHGVFREAILKNEYQSLFKRIELITNFWFSSILIQADKLSKNSIKEYALLISQSIYPYLTEEAKKEYAHLYPSHFA